MFTATVLPPLFPPLLPDDDPSSLPQPAATAAAARSRTSAAHVNNFLCPNITLPLLCRPESLKPLRRARLDPYVHVYRTWERQPAQMRRCASSRLASLGAGEPQSDRVGMGGE